MLYGLTGTMTALINSFSASLPQLIGMASLLGVAFLMASLGAVAAGPNRRSEGDLIFGWAVVSSVFTVFGTLKFLSFTSIAFGLAILSIAALILLWHRQGRVGPVGAWKAATLVLAMLLLAAAMIPSQWDDLTHWLPNARYLLEQDAFPGPGLPKSPSNFPAYPYGVAVITYLASRVAGLMVDNATSMLNILLVASYGMLIARIAVTIAQSDTQASEAGPTPKQLNTHHAGWAFCALAILIATALSPTYVTRLVLSSYADLPTTVTIGFASVMVWLMLNALSADETKLAHSYAWQAGLGATAAIALKQVNLVFFLSLLIAISLVALRDKSISLRDILALSHKFIILPLAIYIIWRIYVSYNFTGGEHAFRPFADWIFDKTDEILARMSLIASKKGGYFGVMTLATLLALRVVWHPRTAFHRLTLITATMFLSYNGFLLMSYLGAFSEGEALRAASYWRYNTHLGGVCLVFVACVIAHAWRRCERCRVPKPLAVLAVVLVFVAPLVMAKKFRFDLEPRIIYARSITKNIRALLTEKDRLLLAELDSDGRYLMVMRYGLYGSAAVVSEMSAWHRPFAKSLSTRLAQQNVSHIWIYDIPAQLVEIIGVPSGTNKSYLLSRENEGWIVKGRWPHPTKAGNDK
jgi:hypothetical protein